MKKYATSFTTILAAATLAACAGSTAPPSPSTGGPTPIPVPGTPAAARQPALPGIPAVDGALRLEVGYPSEGQALAVRDSNFIFGSTGSGQTRLTINDAPVTVSPNGGFLAFIPVPADGVYRLRATKGTETASLDLRVTVPAAGGATAAGARIVSPFPTGTWSLPAGEVIDVGFRAPRGGSASLLLPGGERVMLVERGAVASAAVGDEFRTTGGGAADPGALVTYSGMLTVRSPIAARDTAVAAPRVGRAAASREAAILEYVLGTDTVRTPLRFTLGVMDAAQPRVGVVTAPANAPRDYTIRGRVDTSGPFHFFWPAGTRLAITGQKDGMLRVRLTETRSAWVPASDVSLMREGAPPPAGVIGSARFAPQPQYIDLRIPTPERLPFEVTQADGTLHIDVFGATSRANFFQYGGLDPFIEYAEWSQPVDGVFRVTMRLASNVWGYNAFYDEGGALVLRVRRPPAVDPAAPLRGLLIAVDPGHGGSDRSTRGPTGLTEADANLYIALQLRDQLQAAGAQVMMTRTEDATVGLGDRPLLAAEAGAHILVSVHNNAFPDGVNPWNNNGTSTYYYHPHSAPLARAMQRELLAELGLRDIGYGRADLALVRPTWMPSVLSETAFMMVPEHEAALRDPAVHARIAAAHVRALESFLREYARQQ